MMIGDATGKAFREGFMNALIDIDQLRTFIAIVETGSFTKAAEVVHKTQSAVSMQMKRLEERLDRPIFVTDGVESAVAQAATAAGDKAVTVVGGVNLAQQLLRARLVDELHIDVMPVLFGAGLRFFGDARLESTDLQVIDVRQIGRRTSLRFRVKK